MPQLIETLLVANWQIFQWPILTPHINQTQLFGIPCRKKWKDNHNNCNISMCMILWKTHTHTKHSLIHYQYQKSLKCPYLATSMWCVLTVMLGLAEMSSSDTWEAIKLAMFTLTKWLELASKTWKFKNNNVFKLLSNSSQFKAFFNSRTNGYSEPWFLALF